MRFQFNPFTQNLDIVDVGGSGGGPVYTLTGNSGGAIGPDGVGNINVLGGSGITIVGTTNTLTANLNSYFNQTTTTTDATPDDSMTIALGATPGLYTFDINISAFNATDTLGAGYSIFASVRTDGATATVIPTPDKIVNEEVGMTDANATVVASANNAVIRVTGIAAKTIRWRAITFYTLVT